LHNKLPLTSSQTLTGQLFIIPQSNNKDDDNNNQNNRTKKKPLLSKASGFGDHSKLA